MKVVGLEEHFVTPDILRAWQRLAPSLQDPSLKPSSEGQSGRLLLEIGPERIAAMDEAGVDIQVLSLTTPGVQNLPEAESIALARSANDYVADAVKQNSRRFRGLATLATPAPREAARELERAVCHLGLQGAMVFGRIGEKNFDHPDYWPILEVASERRIPLYMHPQTPPLGVRQAYYTGFNAQVDALFASAGIGWHFDAGMQIVRMALAGVFERFKNLRVITGHFGEVMLFYLDRIDMLSGPAKLPRKVSDYIREHVYVTQSGLFSQRYLRWAIEVVGSEHIMMSTDYPFAEASNKIAKTYLLDADLTNHERRGIASENWERLCADIRR